MATQRTILVPPPPAKRLGFADGFEAVTSHTSARPSFAPVTKRRPSALNAISRTGPPCLPSTRGLVVGFDAFRSHNLTVGSPTPPVASQCPSGLNTGDAQIPLSWRTTYRVGDGVERFHR